ncbi:hypothetical protein Tco_0733693 [Tanacetum coccineum]
MTGGEETRTPEIRMKSPPSLAYLYGVVAIMESMWLLSSSSSLLKNVSVWFRDRDSSFNVWKGKCNPSSQSVEKTGSLKFVRSQKGHLKGMLFQRAVKHFVIQRRDSDNHLVIEDWASREMHYNQLQRAAFHGDPNEELKQYRCGKRHSYSQVLKQMFIEKVRFARYNMTLILLGKKQGTILDKIEALKGAVVLALEMEDDCTNSDKEKHNQGDQMLSGYDDGKRKKNCVYTLKAKVMTFGVQKHGGVHEVHDEKRVWFEVELQGAQRDREAEDFQVSNDAAVAQRRLEDKQPEEKTNMDSLVKEQEKVHLGIKVGANITVIEYHGPKCQRECCLKE